MIRIELVGGEAAVARFQGLSQKAREALRKAVLAQWLALQGYIVSAKLSGQVLKRVTGNLASSINAGASDSNTTFEDSPTQIVGKVGTKVQYARVHEYGGSVTIKAHTRLQTQAWGRPINPVSVSVREHTATFPERSFLRSGLRDRSSQIRAALTDALKEAMA